MKLLTCEPCGYSIKLHACTIRRALSGSCGWPEPLTRSSTWPSPTMVTELSGRMGNVGSIPKETALHNQPRWCAGALPPHAVSSKLGASQTAASLFSRTHVKCSFLSHAMLRASQHRLGAGRKGEQKQTVLTFACPQFKPRPLSAAQVHGDAL